MKLCPYKLVLLVSMVGVSALQSVFTAKILYYDGTANADIVIAQIEQANDQHWVEAQAFTIASHGESQRESLLEEYERARAIFDKNPQECLFLMFYDGERLIGIGIVQLIEGEWGVEGGEVDFISSFFTTVLFAEYNLKQFFENYFQVLRGHFPTAESFVITASKDRPDRGALLLNLGFTQTSDELCNKIRKNMVDKLHVYQFTFH
jgi:hypothetical protein